MEKKTLLITIIAAPVLAIIALILMSTLGNDSERSSSQSDSRPVNVSDYSDLGKYCYALDKINGGEGSGKSTTSANASPLACYMNAYALFQDNDAGNKSAPRLNRSAAPEPKEFTPVSNDHFEEINDEPEDEDWCILDSFGEFRARGKIDGKYEIVMEFSRDPEIHGTYYYTKNGPKNRMVITGAYNNSSLSFIEYNNEGVETGTFSGQVDDDIYTGVWSNSLNGKRMPFRLKITLI